MTFERFQEIWIQSGLPLPTHTDHSPALIDALCKAAEGDFSDFEKVRDK